MHFQSGQMASGSQQARVDGASGSLTLMEPSTRRELEGVHSEAVHCHAVTRHFRHHPSARHRQMPAHAPGG